MASDRAEPAAAGPGDPLSAREWIELLFDSASFDEQFEAIATPDPLQFEDSRPYAERVAEARERSGGDESVVTGTASVGGQGGSGDALGRSSSFRRGRLRRGNGWGAVLPPIRETMQRIRWSPRATIAHVGICERRCAAAQSGALSRESGSESKELRDE